jgi:hypothetical protein
MGSAGATDRAPHFFWPRAASYQLEPRELAMGNFADGTYYHKVL